MMFRYFLLVFIGIFVIYGLGAQAPVVAAPLPNGIYSISPLCAPEMKMDAEGVGLSDGTRANITASTGTADQAWIFTHMTNGYYKIQAAYAPFLCLDDNHKGQLDGNIVQIFQDNASSAQRWQLTAAGGGTFTLTPLAAPASRLDCPGKTSGTELIIWHAMSLRNEKWIIHPATFAKEAAYNGSFYYIPGTIQAENYDTGGQGLAYNSQYTTNQGGQYRQDGIGIEACADQDGGYDVGWAAGGQWLRYTVFVAARGKYTVAFRVAATQTGGGSFHLQDSKNNNLTGSVHVPDTSGPQSWTTVTASVTLPMGKQVITLVEESGGYNINAMMFNIG
jgi:hypothetical protein